MEREQEKSRVRVKVREKVKTPGREGIRRLDLLLLLAGGALVGLSVGYLVAGGFKRFFSSDDFSIREKGTAEGGRVGKSPVLDIFSLEDASGTAEDSGTGGGEASSEEDPFLDHEDPS